MNAVIRKSTALLVVLLMIVSLLPTSVFAAEKQMNLNVSSATGCPGEDVAVRLELSNNPGIASLKIKVHYDDTNLTLKSVAFAEGFGAYVTAPEPYTNPQTISFVSPLETVDKDGLFATLTFTISEDATEDVLCPVTVTYDEDDVFDGDFSNVELIINQGSIGIFHGLPGDINGDKSVNNKDAIMLFRYIAGWSVAADHAALDCNGDGKINNKDAITLFRYVAGWANISLHYGAVCQHTLEAVSESPASCTEAGNIAYWHCTACGKYFSDANATREIALAETLVGALGHDWVVVPGYPAQPGVPGLTDGESCQRCGLVKTAQVEIPALPSETHNIIFELANGDPYLQTQVANGILTNPNPSTFNESAELNLLNPAVNGYLFQGWYDLPSGGNLVRKIERGTTYDVQLYAHWEKIAYSVQYKSSLFVDRDHDTYTVDTGLVLPTPRLSSYVFTGWANEQGKLYASRTIPVGTTGNITLTANWTSERNKAWTKNTLGEPVIHVDEELGMILMAYEIGEIQNVPLYTIKDFGYIAGDGVTKTETSTYAVTITESAMQAYTSAVTNATTASSNWTLSEDWNEITSVDEQWCEENGYTVEEAVEYGRSEANTWNVSSGCYGSTDVAIQEACQYGVHQESKINSDYSNTDTSKHNVGVNGEIGKAKGMYRWKIGGSYGYESSDSTSVGAGAEVGAAVDEAYMVSGSAVSSSGWQKSASYGASSTASLNESLSAALSNKISSVYGYGTSYASGGSSSNTQGLSSTQSASDEYAASVTFSKETTNSVTSTWTTQATKPGYHRWVVAGTAHVFGVVGYDMAQNAFFVYTYSVMDDETYEFEDYSYTTAYYDDEQNGVISFEIPEDVAEYVAELTCFSDGLKVNQETGIITGYTGSDPYVIIPEYMNVGNGKVIKISGLSTNAFSGNTSISAVTLSDFITSIPDNAFSGCTSLLMFTGENISSIGNNAFSGCSAIDICDINQKVLAIGSNAFDNVGCVRANVANAEVAVAAASSGAKKVYLYSGNIENATEAFAGKSFQIENKTEEFEFNGTGKTYQDFKIESDAGKTVIRNANFVCAEGIPISLSSSEAGFDGVTVHAPGIAMVLSSPSTNVGLQGTIIVESNNENALLCKNISLYELNPQVDGRIVVIQKILACGEIHNTQYISSASYEIIDETTFENLLHSYTLYFDANGGTCSETSRVVANSTRIGTLPVPTLQYHSFDGWFLEDGTQVTEDTVFSDGVDVTVYAHWTWNSFIVTFNKNDNNDTTDPAVLSQTSLRGYCGQALGTLPIPTRPHHEFLGWYTAVDGGDKVTASTVYTVAQDRTLYARWKLKDPIGWIKASELPSGGRVVSRKWSYTKTTRTESRETSLAGYTQTGSYWVQSGSGSVNYATFPGGFDTGHWIYTSFNKSALEGYETTTTRRTVTNGWAGYVYWHWMYDTGGANGHEQRAIYNKMGYGPANGYYYKYFGAWTSGTSYPSGGTGYCNNLGIENFIRSDYTGWDNCQGATRWFRFDYFTSSYVDEYKMFKYQKVENLESTTQVTAGTNGNVTISNVVEWVKYIPR